MDITIVIPTYNEGHNIETLVQRIFSLDIPGLGLLIVDDNSPDKTAETVRRLGNQYPIQLIVREHKSGIGSAYVAGINQALSQGSQIIFQMDADLSHDPADIPRMVAAVEKADVVVGSRRVEGGKIVGWGWMRLAMSHGAMWFARKILGLQTKDVTAGFRCFRAEVLRRIHVDTIRSNGYAFQEELLYRVERLGYCVTEIPVTFLDRQHGKSKLSKKDILEFFIRMIQLRFSK